MKGVIEARHWTIHKASILVPFISGFEVASILNGYQQRQQERQGNYGGVLFHNGMQMMPETAVSATLW